MFLGAFGTCVGDANYVSAADFDGDECITLVDYQSWVECFRDANSGMVVPGAVSPNKVNRKNVRPARNAKPIPAP